MSNGYRYTGSGERYRGVPARDLSQEEFDRLGPLEQRRVTESGAYEAIASLADMTVDELRAVANDAGIEEEVVKKARTKAELIALIENPTPPTGGEDSEEGGNS